MVYVSRVIPREYVEIRDMDTGLKARTVTDKEGNYLTINKGIKQGDPLSSLLFPATLEEVFKKLIQDVKGININETYLNHLRIVYDLVQITEIPEELQTMIEKWRQTKDNLGKTKILDIVKKLKEIKINQKLIEKGEEVISPDQNITC